MLRLRKAVLSRLSPGVVPEVRQCRPGAEYISIAVRKRRFAGFENTFDRDLIASAEIAADVGAILSHNGPPSA